MRKTVPDREVTYTFTLKAIRAEWRFLAFVNYLVDKKKVEAFLPPGVELDLWENNAVISVVGKQIQDVRVAGLFAATPRRWACVDVTLLVKRQGGAGYERGAAVLRRWMPRPKGIFSSVLAQGVSAFVHTDGAVQFEPEGKLSKATALYTWGRANRLKVVTTGAAGPLDSTGWEKFVALRGWEYTRGHRHGWAVAPSEHPPWVYWEAAESAVEIETAGLARELSEIVNGPVDSAFLVKGSPVAMGRGQTVR